MVSFVSFYDIVDDYAGDLNVSRVQRILGCYIFYLNDNDTAAGFSRFSDSQGFARADFAVHRNVAVFVGCRAADDSYINFVRMIPEPFFAAQFNNFNDIFLRYIVDFAAFQTRINEGTEADFGNRAGTAARDVAEPLGQRALRQVVGFYFIVIYQFAQTRCQVEVTADNTFQHAFVAEVVQAAFTAVALACSINNCHVFRRIISSKGSFHFFQYSFRNQTADETARCDSCAVFNLLYCFSSRYKFCHDEHLLLLYILNFTKFLYMLMYLSEALLQNR
ncbi:Uncharacterised protein [uncultured Megasphaera sp.]|nr:Uncharacterised protein [uncultured Megasphaera sp.]SCJ69905.1 Uncharacterised protein [uncultured Ruminococcus sp.]